MASILGPDDARTAQPFDFRAPVRVRGARRERVAATLDAAATALGGVLTHALQLGIGVRVGEFEEATPVALLQSTLEPVFALQAPGRRELVLCAFASPLAQLCVERLLGGPGNPRDIERRATEIEIALLALLAQQLDAAACRISQPPSRAAEVLPVPTYLDAKARTAIEPLGGIVSRFDFAFGEHCSGLHFFWTYGEMDRIWSFDFGSAAAASGAPQQPLGPEGVADTRVRICAFIPDQAIRIREVAALAVGDVLQLDRNMNDDVELRLGTRVLFIGQPGTVADSVGVRIHKTV